MSLFLKRQKVLKRRAFKKTLKRIERIALAIVMVLASFAIIYGGSLLLSATPYLAIQQVIVESEKGRLSSEEIIQVSGVEKGENLFFLDLDEVHARLAANPWIRTAVVRRRLPNGIAIRVEEYEPFAIFVEKQLFYVDRDGHLFKELEPHDEKTYPVMSGIEKEDRGRLHEAMEMIEWYDRSSIGQGFPLSEVNYSFLKGYSIVTVGQPMQIFFGHADVKSQMEKVDRFSSSILERSTRIHYIVVYDEERIVVKYKTT